MSSEIVRYEASEMDLDTLQRTARMLVASGYFDAKGETPTQIAQLATKILAGRELGYGPFASVQGIHVIQGKPVISANLMAAAVKGHPRYDYRIRQMDDSAVEIEFFEDGQSLGKSAFSRKDAEAASLMGKSVWKQFPRNMLFARALSNGVRWYCPDVFNGNAVYVEGEIESRLVDDYQPGHEPSVVVVDRDTGEVVEGSYTNSLPPEPESIVEEPEPAVEEWPPHHPSGKLPLTAKDYEFESGPDAILWGASMGVFDNQYNAKNSFLKHTKDGKNKLEKSRMWISTIRAKLAEQDEHGPFVDVPPTNAGLATQPDIPF